MVTWNSFINRGIGLETQLLFFVLIPLNRQVVYRASYKENIAQYAMFLLGHYVGATGERNEV